MNLIYKQRVVMRYIIIGAGPSGLATGIQILKETQKQLINCECLVFEQNRLRQKPCGGLITPKAKNLLFQLGISTNTLYSCNHIEVNYKHITFDYSTDSQFYICQRSDLLSLLTNRYTSLGGKIIWDKVISIDSKRNCINTNTGEFFYDFLIIAHGYNRQKYKKHTDDKICSKKVSIGVNSIVALSPKLDMPHQVDIFFLKDLEGYGWRFPLSNGMFNVGFAGKILKGNFLRIKKEFNQILGIDLVKYQGCLIPIDCRISSNISEELNKNIYRVGEAGGYFDSFTGEGIYFALLTGILAASHIVGAISTYRYVEIKKIISKLCKGSTFTRKLLYKQWILLPALLRIGQLTKKLDAHMTDNLILRYKYDYFTAYLSPLFCYLNKRFPFDIQKTLDSIIRNRDEIA